MCRVKGKPSGRALQTLTGCTYAVTLATQGIDPLRTEWTTTSRLLGLGEEVALVFDP
jgi:hypothetical protein